IEEFMAERKNSLVAPGISGFCGICMILCVEKDVSPEKSFICRFRELLKTAPKIAVPILCPKFLEKTIPLVTIPLCRHGTILCGPTNEGVERRPNPAPNVI